MVILMVPVVIVLAIIVGCSDDGSLIQHNNKIKGITTIFPYLHFQHHLWPCLCRKSHRLPFVDYDDNTVDGYLHSRSNVQIVLYGVQVALKMERGYHIRYTYW